ncbi:MAG: 3-deoxy-7-phosphoheptulonate synthase [Planctomycetota bacterium]
MRSLDLTVDGGRRLLHLDGRDEDPDLRAGIELWDGVQKVLSFADATPLASKADGRARVPLREGPHGPAPDGASAVEFGPDTFVWIAGPCAVDKPEFLGDVAQAAARAGASMLRGGAFKPRTSPYAFQGLGRDGLLLLSAVSRDVGLPCVTEVLDPRDLDFIAQHADMVQLGARSMQNFPLLREAGACGRPVMLKRAPSATLDELVAAAEYVLAAGCTDLVLCERGVRGFDPGRRNLLDLSAVPALGERTRLPVIVDPSHATGRRSLVVPMAKASVPAGAAGVMVEVHPRPSESRSDAAQALLPAELDPLGRALRALAALEGRRVPTGPLYNEARDEVIPRPATPEAQPESRTPTGPRTRPGRG